MTQYAKDEIRQRIIDRAREEFLEKGFERASIRTITARAKTSKSNLYNYYKDKDDLFASVLESTTTSIRNGIVAARQFNEPKGLDEYSYSSQNEVIGTVMNFVIQNADDVKLLLFKSQGSTLEHFKYEVLEAFTDNMCDWARSIRPGRELSRAFIRSICSFYLSLIEQTILFGKENEMPKLLKEFTTFIYNGWKGVLQ